MKNVERTIFLASELLKCSVNYKPDWNRMTFFYYSLSRPAFSHHMWFIAPLYEQLTDVINISRADQLVGTDVYRLPFVSLREDLFKSEPQPWLRVIHQIEGTSRYRRNAFTFSVFIKFRLSRALGTSTRIYTIHYFWFTYRTDIDGYSLKSYW